MDWPQDNHTPFVKPAGESRHKRVVVRLRKRRERFGRDKDKGKKNKEIDEARLFGQPEWSTRGELCWSEYTRECCWLADRSQSIVVGRRGRSRFDGTVDYDIGPLPPHSSLGEAKRAQIAIKR